MADASVAQGGRALSASLDRRFRLTARGTTIAIEFAAAVTGSLTMSRGDIDRCSR
jgi:hypothetical protein